MVRLCLLLFVGLSTPHLAVAGGLDPQAAVTLASRAMAKAGITGASPIAPSRPLPDCTVTPTAGPWQGKWSTVEISCTAPRWTRALRTRATDETPRSAAAPQETPPKALALGLTRSMARGEVIGPDDIAPLPHSSLAADQVFTDPAHLIGRRLRQTLPPGRALLARHLEPDWDVVKDATVVVVSQSGGISVSVQGRADDNAALGDIVPVISLSSGRTIMARVIGKDIVAVTLKPFGNGP